MLSTGRADLNFGKGDGLVFHSGEYTFIVYAQRPY
jgi:hypothetical protein